MIAIGKDNAEEMFPIVDEEGNITGAATRGECHGGSMLLHPVVHLHVFNAQGDIYLQHRPQWKDIQPGKWDTAVGGHVDLGESVQQALLRVRCDGRCSALCGHLQCGGLYLYSFSNSLLNSLSKLGVNTSLPIEARSSSIVQKRPPSVSALGFSSPS